MMSTTGYLLGFVLAAGVVGFLAERGWDRSPLGTAGAMLIGNIVIYIPGLIWLGTVLGWDNPIVAGMTLSPVISEAHPAAALMPGIWALLSRGKQ